MSCEKEIMAFKVGDKVRCINAESHGINWIAKYFPAANAMEDLILTIKKSYSDNNFVSQETKDWLHKGSSFELVDEYLDSKREVYEQKIKVKEDPRKACDVNPCVGLIEKIIKYHTANKFICTTLNKPEQAEMEKMHIDYLNELKKEYTNETAGN